MVEEKYPELQDIKQAIRKYAALNPECTIVFGTVSLKDSEETCEDCGGNCEEINEVRSGLGAIGQLENLRFMLYELRNLIEDNIDEEGYVYHI